MNSPIIPAVLRVARPSPRNTQQTAFESDTARNGRATAAQQPSLKALALLALARNSRATTAQQRHETTPKTAQQTPLNMVALLRDSEGGKPSNSAPSTASEPSLLRVARVRARNTQQPRAVVRFRFRDDQPNAWATCLGAPGETTDTVIADLRAKWPSVMFEGGDP